MFTKTWPQPWPIVLEQRGEYSLHQAETLLGMASRLLHVLVPVSANKARTGGWLLMSTVTLDHGRPRLTTRLMVPIGYVADGRGDTYRTIATEKARRLVREHHRRGHRTSYQSRAEGHGRYGGAILTGNTILSFSGLEEKDDEALVLMLAVWLGLLNLDQASMLAEISTNDSFDRLAAAFLLLPTAEPTRTPS